MPAKSVAAISSSNARAPSGPRPMSKGQLRAAKQDAATVNDDAEQMRVSWPDTRHRRGEDLFARAVRQSCQSQQLPRGHDTGPQDPGGMSVPANRPPDESTAPKRRKNSHDSTSHQAQRRGTLSFPSECSDVLRRLLGIRGGSAIAIQGRRWVPALT